MDGFKIKIFSVNIRDDDDDDINSVSELKEVLSAFGVNVELKKNSHGYYLTFGYDIDVVNQKITRGAGRKLINSTGGIIVGSVREMQKTMSNDSIAAQLGMSRSTFYRRLRSHETNQSGDEFLF